jgi:DNA-binding response OmpR family regulator
VATTFRPIGRPAATHLLGVAGSTSTDPCDALLLWTDRPEGLIGAMAGLRVRLTTSSPLFRELLRSFRSGVVAVSAPPAADDDLEAVALARRVRPGLRALLSNGAEAIDQRLTALELGFDDAVPNLLDRREVAHRICRLREIARQNAPETLPVGRDMDLDLSARALRRAGRLIHLRPLEFQLLAELARQAGRPVSRAWLLEHVWGSRTHLDSRTVDVHVRWLREKVEPDPDHPVHLLTIRGVGYQLETGLGARPGPRLPAVNTAANGR